MASPAVITAPATLAWPRRLPSLAAAVTTLVLGAIGLGGPQLWRDELATWSAARRGVGELFALAGNADAFYLPYYLFTHCWIALFGDSEIALRLPSLLAAAGAAAVVAALAGRWFGPRAAWCAGLLFALVPMVSRMAQEARPYGFVMLFVALSTWLLVRALAEQRWGSWAGYALALAAVGLTQVTALAVVAGHAVLLARRWSWRFPLAVLAAVLPAVPLGLVSLGGAQGVVGLIPRPGLLDLVGVTAVGPPGSALWPQLFRSTTTAWIVLILALAALLLAQRRRAAAVLGVVAAPILVLWLASQFGPSFFLPRYLVFLLPLLVLPAAATLAALRRPAVIAVAVAALAASTIPDQLATRAPDSHDAAFHPYTMFAEHPGQYADYRALAEHLRRESRPGDVLVHANRANFWFTDTGLDYHWRDPSRPQDALLAQDPIANNTLSATESTDYATRLAGANRVWAIGVGERQDPFAASPPLLVFADPAKAAAVQARFQVSGVTQVPGFTVALMTRR